VAQAANSSNSAQWSKGRLIVQPRAGLSDHQFDLILRPHLARRLSRLSAGPNIQLIELPQGIDEMTA